MKLTDKCKDDFSTWLLTVRNEKIKDGKIEYDLYYLFCYVIPEKLQNSLIIEFFDTVEIFIEIHPNLGAGQAVFYPSFCFIDEGNMANEKYQTFDNGELYYSLNRTEAENESIKLANEFYNQKN